MRCPYCTSEIDNASLVCAQCHRDLYFFRPLLDKISVLEDQMTQLSSLKVLEERVAKLESERQAGIRAKFVEEDVQASLQCKRPWAAVLIAWLMPMLMLLLSHWLIVVVYDLRTLVLRVVSLLIPLPFGFALARAHSLRSQQYALAGIGVAITMALIAVICMSWTTHLVDNVPVLPANARDWREFVEYLLSIAFSFVTGMLLYELWLRTLSDSPSAKVSALAIQAAKIVNGGQTTAKTVQDTAEKITSVTGAIAATGTSVAAAYTGLRAVIGNG